MDHELFSKRSARDIRDEHYAETGEFLTMDDLKAINKTPRPSINTILGRVAAWVVVVILVSIAIVIAATLLIAMIWLFIMMWDGFTETLHG